MFDAIAGAYDFLNHLLSAGADRRWRRHAVKALALSGREIVLDVCAGTADFGLEALGTPAGAARVIGVDFSRGMLERGLRKARRRVATARLHLVQGDATRLPIRSAAVDAVIVAFGLRNVERLDEALDEIRRTLTTGGTLALLEFAIPERKPIRAVYLWYFTHVLPAVGRMISGHRSAYAYLPASVQTFPPPTELRTLLARHGFCGVTSVPLTGGIVYLHKATTSAGQIETRGRGGNRAEPGVL